MSLNISYRKRSVIQSVRFKWPKEGKGGEGKITAAYLKVVPRLQCSHTVFSVNTLPSVQAEDPADPHEKPLKNLGNRESIIHPWLSLSVVAKEKWRSFGF